MGGTRIYHIECGNPDSERQIMPIFSYWRFFSDVSTQCGLIPETKKEKWIPKRTIESGISGYRWCEEGSKKARDLKSSMISLRPAEYLLKSTALKLGGFNLEPCVKFKMDFWGPRPKVPVTQGNCLMFYFSIFMVSNGFSLSIVEMAMY